MKVKESLAKTKELGLTGINAECSDLFGEASEKLGI
jgi:hypothetical protein